MGCCSITKPGSGILPGPRRGVRVCSLGFVPTMRPTLVRRRSWAGGSASLRWCFAVMISFAIVSTIIVLWGFLFSVWSFIEARSSHRRG